MDRYILALDQGTTSSRAILFNKMGTTIALHQKEFTQIYPQPGWAEHDPQKICETQLSSARETIKAAGIQVEEVAAIGVAGDQQEALFGQACFREGSAKNIYGTGCFTLLNTGSRAIATTNPLFTTVAWDLGQGLEYALEGSVFIAGAVIQWLRDQLQIPETAPESETLARSVPDIDAVYFVPALAGLEDIEQNWNLKHSFEPAIATDKRDALLSGWSKAVQAARSFKV